jgi:hypothetical protein
MQKCPSCGGKVLPPVAVRPGRPATFCAERCRRRWRNWGRKARRWQRLADEWRQVGSPGALESAERCEEKAAQLRQKAIVRDSAISER